MFYFICNHGLTLRNAELKRCHEANIAAVNSRATFPGRLSSSLLSMLTQWCVISLFLNFFYICSTQLPIFPLPQFPPLHFQPCQFFQSRIFSFFSLFSSWQWIIEQANWAHRWNKNRLTHSKFDNKNETNIGSFKILFHCTTLVKLDTKSPGCLNKYSRRRSFPPRAVCAQSEMPINIAHRSTVK